MKLRDLFKSGRERELEAQVEFLKKQLAREQDRYEALLKTALPMHGGSVAHFPQTFGGGNGKQLEPEETPAHVPGALTMRRRLRRLEAQEAKLARKERQNTYEARKALLEQAKKERGAQ